VESPSKSKTSASFAQNTVEQVLHVFGIVFHEDGENGVSNLRMPGLIGLNASDHPLKHVVAGFAASGRQPHKLQLGTRFPERNSCRWANSIAFLSQRQFIKEWAGAIANQLLVW